MASWQLEVFKMFVCVMFPVVSFHIFNQREIFENWVTKSREEMYAFGSPEANEKFMQMKLMYQQKMRDKKKLEEQNTL